MIHDATIGDDAHPSIAFSPIPHAMGPGLLLIAMRVERSEVTECLLLAKRSEQQAKKLEDRNHNSINEGISSDFRGSNCLMHCDPAHHSISLIDSYIVSH